MNKQQDWLTRWRVMSMHGAEAMFQWWGSRSRLEVIKVVIVRTGQAPRWRPLSHFSWCTMPRHGNRSWHIMVRLLRRAHRCTMRMCWTLDNWMSICQIDDWNCRVTRIGGWWKIVPVLIWHGWRTGWWHWLVIVLTQVWHRCLWTSRQNRQAAVVHVVLLKHQCLTVSKLSYCYFYSYICIALAVFIQPRKIMFH